MATFINPVTGALVDLLAGSIQKGSEAINGLPSAIESAIIGLMPKKAQQGIYNTKKGVADFAGELAQAAYNDPYVGAPIRAYQEGKDRINAVMGYKQQPSITDNPLFNAMTGSGGGGEALFAGALAKTADLKALDLAKQMEVSGVPAAKIWKETGWGKAPDGNWKFEIPDNKASLTRKYMIRSEDSPAARQAFNEYNDFMKDFVKKGYPADMIPARDAAYEKFMNAVKEAPLGLADAPIETAYRGIVNHDRLMNAYPERLGTTRIFPEKGVIGRPGLMAALQPNGSSMVRNGEYLPADVIHVYPGAFKGGERSALESLMHETQHSIQGVEGWQKGGSPEIFGDQTSTFEGLRELAFAKTKKALPNVPVESPEFQKALNDEAERASKYFKLMSQLSPGTDPNAYMRHELYQRLGGEAEARLTASRLDLTPSQRRNKYPWSPKYFQKQAGVPLDELILNKDSAIPSELTVFHGSPYKFDKFDASHIGKGEGAQVYGHGLYFAEEPEVAKTYTPRDLNYENNLLRRYQAAEKSQDFDAMTVYEEAMLHKTPEEIAGLRGDLFPDTPSTKRALEDVSKMYQSRASGNLYKADIPDEMIPSMLYLDGILSEQPQAVQDLAKLWGIKPKGTGDIFGNDVMNEAVNRFGGPQGAANALSARGIPGIKYLDGDSRAAMDGSHNYVVFPGMENRVKILERNGEKIVDSSKPRQPRAIPNFDNLIKSEYGTPKEGAVSAIGYHFSPSDNIQAIDSWKYGTGKSGAESRRLMGAVNDDIRPRAYFYTDDGQGIVPEPGVGYHVYGTRLNNLYDDANDPLGLWKQAEGSGSTKQNNYERLIIQNGFDGMYTKGAFGEQGAAVLLGGKHRQVPVTKLGSTLK